MRFLKQIIPVICMTVGLAMQARTDFGLLSSDITLIIGNDLGRNGYYQQKPIAGLMGEVAEATGPEAVLALGDIHHYQGVQSVDDPLWMTNFELIYSHPELQIMWYPVLGNHEYRGNPQAVVDYSAKSRRWEMPARYYSKTFREGDTTLKTIFLDTPPLIDKYRRKSDVYPDAGRQNMEAQLEWLDKTLEAATEDWIIVVGHHPIYADTDKDESERRDMQARVDSILRKHRVDMYICGHLHNFQHIRLPESGIDYIVNSSGSLSRTPAPIEGTVFCSGSEGFSVLAATNRSLSLHMLDSEGNVIHTVKRTR